MKIRHTHQQSSSTFTPTALSPNCLHQRMCRCSLKWGSAGRGRLWVGDSSGGSVWTVSNSVSPSRRDYLSNTTLWKLCVEPTDIVPWHLTLFSILLIIGGVQMLLCAIQVVNGLLGTLCGDCGCCGCCGVSSLLCPWFLHEG